MKKQEKEKKKKKKKKRKEEATLYFILKNQQFCKLDTSSMCPINFSVMLFGQFMIINFNW